MEESINYININRLIDRIETFLNDESFTKCSESKYKRLENYIIKLE